MVEGTYKKVFSKNLNYYMSLSRKTQRDLTNDLGFNKSAVSTWCNGSRLPRMDKVESLARYFGISCSDLLEEKKRPPVKGKDINVFRRIVGNVPSETTTEDIIDTEEITREMASTGSFFGLQIHGDSMIPNICDGDVVIVRQQEEAETGDIVIAAISDGDAMCKRLRKYKDGMELIANNPTYEPLDFSNQEIKEKPVKIIGKVVELRRKFT